MTRNVQLTLGSLALLCLIAFTGCPRHEEEVLDEALAVKRDAASLPAAGEDYFHDMDGALPLSKEEIQGRNCGSCGPRQRPLLGRSLRMRRHPRLPEDAPPPTRPEASRDNRCTTSAWQQKKEPSGATGPDPSA